MARGEHSAGPALQVSALMEIVVSLLELLGYPEALLNGENQHLLVVFICKQMH